MGVRERRARERDARRKSVLDATRGLVREHGYNGTTTKQIAAACELSEATLFWYFRSKDEIFTSLLFEGIDLMQKRIDELVAADVAPEQALRRMWGLFEELRAGYPEYFHVFTTLANPEATAAVSADVKAELARRSGDNFRRFAELLGSGTSTPGTRVVADVVWAAFVGLGVLHDSRVNLGAPAHPTERELNEVLDVLLTGLRVRR